MIPEERMRFREDAYAILHGFGEDEWWKLYYHTFSYRSAVLAEAGADIVRPIRQLLLRLLDKFGH